MILLFAGGGLVAYHAVELHQESRMVQQGKPNQQAVQSFTQAKENDVPKPIIWPKHPKEGTQFGELRIPRLEVKVPLISGVGDKDLTKGIGHHRNSVLPGEGDNSVLAGPSRNSTKAQPMQKIGQSSFLTISLN